MADEGFDVIITDQEYKQLKLHQQKNAELGQALAVLEQRASNLALRQQQLQQQLAEKDLEVGYLSNLILGLACGGDEPASGAPQHMHSGMFEVLGQSVLQPTKAQEHRKNMLLSAFAKRHTAVHEKVVALEERLESQEALIARLNDMQCEKNEALLQHEASLHLETEARLKTAEEEVQQLRGSLKKLSAENADLRREHARTLAEVKTTENSSQQAIKQLKQQANQLRLDKEALTRKLKEQAERAKQIEMQNAVLRQGLGSSFPKQETKERIRGLIEEYAREVERGLKSIEGLSAAEVQDLLRSEMKELADCIQGPVRGAR